MMYRVLLCVAFCACAVSSNRITTNTPISYSLEDAEALFEKFIVDHEKQYAHEDEKQMRFEIFKESLGGIIALNELHGGIRVFDINSFSDYTAEEKSSLKGFQSSVGRRCKNLTNTDIQDVDVPASWDWRDKHVVTPVKNQGGCGSCYSFSTTGNIEGQFAKKHGELRSFSEQQIVDCSVNNGGCDGGEMSIALEDIITAGGIERESDYAYAGVEQKCAFKKSKVAAQVTDCATYNLTTQEKLKHLVYTTGPLSIAVDATFFFIYGGHVFKNCSCVKLDHAVLLVGYGTDPVEGDYWIVKNSWGPGWGEDGYIRIERGEGKGSCGLLNAYVTSATVA